jgi:hypothetical protein
LRNPVEVLDVILADALFLAQQTSVKAQATGLVMAPESQAPEAPPWLTREYLEDSQLSVTERTTELASQLQAGLDQQAARPAGPPTPQQQQENAEANRFLAMVRQAMPFLNKGKEAFESAGQSLATEEFAPAGRQQFEAIAALRDARERFLELPGLIELAYSREVQVQGLIPPVQDDSKADEAAEEADSEAEMPPEQRTAYLQIARALQEQNADRGERIARLIEEKLAGLPVPPDAGDEPSGQAPQDPAAQQVAAERQQLELASQLIKLAQEEMTAAEQSLAESSGQPEDAAAEAPENAPSIDETAIETARTHVAQTVEQLQALRRLFFSIVEHLRETAQRQAELNDETEQLAGLEEEGDLAKKTGPLSVRQKELQAFTEQIALALDEQAKQQPTGAVPQQNVDPQQLEQIQQMQENVAQAARLVGEGGTEMKSADENLAAEKPQLDTARTHQDQALTKLVEALALLQPPQPNQQNQQQQDQQQDQQQQQGESEQDQEKSEQMGTDPARLLQAIRDREAQRRRDQERRERFEQEPVEKDW